MKENVGFELPGINLEGEYTIQLFDENGELVKEEKKHNCINKAIFSTAYWNQIYNGLINNIFKSDVNGGNLYNLGLTNWLMLTKDADSKVNDYKNPIIMGETIGYAHIDNPTSYNDDKRGIINLNETGIIENCENGGVKPTTVTKHIVWDFGTDKGNGTFDNIYLTPTPFNKGENSARENFFNRSGSIFKNPNNMRGMDFNIIKSFIIDSNNVGSSGSDSGPISSNDTDVFMQCLILRNGKRCHDTIMKLDIKTWNVQYITLSVPSTKVSIPSYIVQAGGYFWRIEYNYSCTRYNLDGSYLDEINLKNKFSSTPVDLGTANYIGYSSSYNASMYLNFFTGDNKYLYIGYKDENNNCFVCSLDNKGNKISENATTMVDNSNRYNFCCINIIEIEENRYLLVGGGKKEGKVYRINNGILTEVNKDLFYGMNMTCGDPYIILHDERKKCSAFLYKNGYLYNYTPFTTYSSYDYYYYEYTGSEARASDTFNITTFTPWTSHVKLDSPITKTSANTMKIQYDITCEYVPVGGIENIE
jgi:hypothetical protein